MQRRTVQDDLSDVGAAIAWADDLARKAGIPEQARLDLQVCLEEALANLIIHGRASGAGKNVAIEIDATAERIEARVFDTCVPFDAARAPLPSRDAHGIGGNGLKLLRAFATRLAYESDGDRNILTIVLDAAIDARA